MVNYRTPDDLTAFIRAFAKVQYEVPCTLHVVNVDPLEADQHAAEVELEAITVPTSFVYFPSNVGYAFACNSVANAVREDSEARQTIAFFNADTRLTPGVLDHCHWHLHQNSDWGILSPRQVDDDGLITHAGIYGTREAPSFEGRWKAKDSGQFNELRTDCVTVSGAAYFVKRRVWDALTDCDIYREAAPLAQGAFLPTPHFYEETFCSYHAIEHGWKVVYDGRVGMIHRWHKASPVGGIAQRVYMPQSRELFRAACDLHGIPHD